MATTKAYKKWYQENGDEFNQRRRLKYANDPLYRQSQLDSTTRSRAKKRQGNAGKNSVNQGTNA